MGNYSNILDNLKPTPPRELNDHILVIDAMNMLIRSFSLLKAMNPSGHHVGGLVGFLRSLGFVTRTFDPSRVIIVWDGKGGSANRKNIDPNYKAQRATSRITHWGLYDTKAEETEALIGQLFRTQDYLECLPVQQLMMEKLEADDIIAYLAKTASKSKKKLTIVSSDSDGTPLSDTDTVAITVTPVNDPPVADNETATTNEDTAITVDVLVGDTDTENDPLTITQVNGTAIAEAKTVLNMKIKQIKLNTRMWPAVMFANKRIIKEIGFVKTPINSIGAKNNFMLQCIPGIQKMCSQ